ncbi:unnamed protein product [Mytilus edulis]|uniref:Uncharacterized protein n=1 Tax=Mytilus edulis TaxID=6550 RepID=A0A8S3REM3_MYTED|nr:unnamed protein product [Mytilus edulis]
MHQQSCQVQPKLSKANSTRIYKSFKRTILRQETEIKLALTGQSDFKPKSEYSYLEVTEDRYFRMDLKQKEHVFKKFQNANLKSRHHEEDEGMFIDDTDHSGALTVTADGSGITSVPFPILKGIFEKAATLYHSQSDIVSFPGKPGAANIIGKYFITSSTDAAKPHLVTVLTQVKLHVTVTVRDGKCIKYALIQLQPQNTVIYLKSLANLNMPCGRGKKPHKATQKRKGNANKRNETAVTYLDEHDQPQVPPPRPPDGGYVIYFLKIVTIKCPKCYGCKGI